MIPRLVRLATLFAFLSHGVLILTARYRASYDAYVHMFFADHYRMDWWSLWDERWYTGFPVTSYPPLVHQLIAAPSHLIGLDAAFGLVLWITVTLLPLGVFAFAGIFTGRVSASYAALGAAFLPAVYLTAHIFGQLPFLAGTVLSLFGAASLARYLKEGGGLNIALTLALTTTTLAAHHAVLLVQPFLMFAVLWNSFFQRGALKSQGMALAWDASKLVFRLLLFLILATGLCLLVIFPFWEWGLGQTIQTPIDHASRHNFFQDPFAPLLFFLPMYGPLIIFIPAIWFLVRKRHLLGLGSAFGVLFLTGLGGTTPLPRFFFGSGWEWLTYDRFAFWASLLLLPFFGMAIIYLRRNRSKTIGEKMVISLAASSLIVALATIIHPLQPGPVDMSRILDFLEQEDRSRWRYLTFGFGDQLALLSTLTDATTIDGSYHTARSLPELRVSGLAQIDSALWFPNGLVALDPILQKAGERGVRWGFVNVPQYIPVLERNGWNQLTTLLGGVQVWENPQALEPAASSLPPARPFASFVWGTFPLLSLLTTLTLASLRFFPLQAKKTIRIAHSFLAGLIPLALCFWYYKIIAEFPHPRVYFTYDHALLFAGDILMFLAVLLWVSVRITTLSDSTVNDIKLNSRYPTFYISLAALCVVASVSTIWSRDWRTSLYISFHLWIVFLFILSMQDWKEAWRPVMFGLCAALTFQVIMGYTGFFLQSTSFLQPLEMKWPGVLDPSLRGASVVQLQNGLRVLRAYGTLPHPNILGGFALICLLGPLYFFRTGRNTNIPALLLYTLGVVLILFTFSRSAWLGLIAFLVVLYIKSKALDQRRLFLMTASTALTVFLTLYPLRELVFTRISTSTVPTEQLSSFGRSWLTQQAADMIKAQPLTGVGIGSFILNLADYAVVGAIIEPVHNLFLLLGAEMGLVGMISLPALFIVLVWNVIKTQKPHAILASAALAGVGLITFFDHYFWSIAPGRLMLGLVLGLWAGQALHDES